MVRHGSVDPLMGRMSGLPKRRATPAVGATLHRDCITCSGRNRPSHLPGLVRCETCGLISADLEISDCEIMKLYDETFFTEVNSLTISPKRKVSESTFGIVSGFCGSVPDL